MIEKRIKGRTDEKERIGKRKEGRKSKEGQDRFGAAGGRTWMRRNSLE